MLYLLPNLLNPNTDHALLLPKSVEEAVFSLQGLFAESEKGGRFFLSHFMDHSKALKIPIALINEHTPSSHFDFFLEPVAKGENWGFVSDAGLPCLADPGSAFVLRARALKIDVKALCGPSSITLALMLSGLPGQRFSFHGYISKEKNELQKWEAESKREQASQIFIETPYRNGATLETCLKVLKDETLFSISCDLTLPTEWTQTLTIANWKKQKGPDLSKRPAIFLLYQG